MQDGGCRAGKTELQGPKTHYNARDVGQNLLWFGVKFCIFYPKHKEEQMAPPSPPPTNSHSELIKMVSQQTKNSV